MTKIVVEPVTIPFGAPMTSTRLLSPSAVRHSRSGWALAVVLFLSSLMAEAASMQTIRTNGPASNRINVVFFSEGYRSSEFAQFLVDATNAMNVLTTEDPFQEYSPYFNAFAISVASFSSGTGDGAPTTNTYFQSFRDAAYWNLITIPAGANGQGKVDQLLQQFMPRNPLPILLVNDRLTYIPGGSGGPVAISTPVAPAPPWNPYILPHEVGHTLADLGDEYSSYYPYPVTQEDPNTTRETNRNLIKWRAWIAPGTPVPTPPTGQYVEAVGLFEGANYNPTGWFRPKYNCRMRVEGSSIAFCEVCREALVLSFYRKVRPIETYAPATTALTLTNPTAQTFSVTVPPPATHNHTVQWLTNGVPVGGITTTNLTLLPQTLGNGTNLIKAVVRDTTLVGTNQWVLTDSSNLLSQTVTWTARVSLVELRLSSPRWLGSNRFAFRVAGYAPQGFSILASTNTSNWVLVTTNALVNGQFNFTNNTGPTNHPRRFFRARTPPP